MHILFTPVFLLSLLAASPALAAGPQIDFTSPAEGAKVDAMSPLTVSYEYTLGGPASHAHLYLDGKEAALLRQPKGSHKIDSLSPGKHEVCAKLVDRNHTPIGVERCVKITVE